MYGFYNINIWKRKTCENRDKTSVKSAHFKLIVLCFVRITRETRTQISIEQKRIILATNISLKGSHHYPVHIFLHFFLNVAEQFLAVTC
jgi:hypothetical protein